MELEPSPDVAQSGWPVPPSGRKKRWRYLIVPLLGAGFVVWSLNYVLVQRHVSRVLNEDERNAGYAVSARYRFFLDPATLVLDLRIVSSVAPADLFRGLFQSAGALVSAGRRFERVILSRDGEAVFVMTGEDFGRLGVEFAAGQNPVYLIRTLPEKLYKPSGEAAFGRWEGGMLGVLGKQMEDANEAGRLWAGAR